MIYEQFLYLMESSAKSRRRKYTTIGAAIGSGLGAVDNLYAHGKPEDAGDAVRLGIHTGLGGLAGGIVGRGLANTYQMGRYDNSKKPKINALRGAALGGLTTGAMMAMTGAKLSNGDKLANAAKFGAIGAGVGAGVGSIYGHFYKKGHDSRKNGMDEDE